MQLTIWIIVFVLATLPFVVPPCVDRFAKWADERYLVERQSEHTRFGNALHLGTVYGDTSGHLRRAKAEGAGQPRTPSRASA